ncbi:putative quinol monooxygenase [Leptolyngbya sp. FACHB-261]|uniref:putative quinol monooxygenase n=1 Tax=Leptolyngbya sp. FACHB-261 TaxID=2692806 RepID=UPI00168A366B|nr:putative quinol monooxygenase [Leptolyngbya sp. FACHB-261]MBD2100725.1 antibiotic biosynthesis monooxygenase [Leptolyngbya sp. FACHB-261]
MADKTIQVVARIIAQASKLEEVKARLFGLLEPTRAEKGCIRYELFQSSADPSEFVFIEEWASDFAITAHLGSDHVQEAFLGAENLLAAPPDVRRYYLLA